jgi:hypothetical protein
MCRSHRLGRGAADRLATTAVFSLADKFPVFFAKVACARRIFAA